MYILKRRFSLMQVNVVAPLTIISSAPLLKMGWYWITIIHDLCFAAFLVTVSKFKMLDGCKFLKVLNIKIMYEFAALCTKL